MSTAELPTLLPQHKWAIRQNAILTIPKGYKILRSTLSSTRNAEERQSRPSDPTQSQWMQLTETSNAYEFWNHPEEDIYTESDGEPV